MNEELNGVPCLVCDDNEPRSPASPDKDRSTSQKRDQNLDSTRELIRELNAWLEIQEPRKRALGRSR